jgi:hypothetical protein
VVAIFLLGLLSYATDGSFFCILSLRFSCNVSPLCICSVIYIYCARFPLCISNKVLIKFILKKKFNKESNLKTDNYHYLDDKKRMTKAYCNP